MTRPYRRSDRWVTPGVVCTAIVCGSLVVLGVAAMVAYLAARGVDAQPVVQLAGIAVGACGSAGTLVLQLVGRKTVAKIERRTGLLAFDVADGLAEVLPVNPIEDELVRPHMGRPRHRGE